VTTQFFCPYLDSSAIWL